VLYPLVGGRFHVSQEAAAGGSRRQEATGDRRQQETGGSRRQGAGVPPQFVDRPASAMRPAHVHLFRLCAQAQLPLRIPPFSTAATISNAQHRMPTAGLWCGGSVTAVGVPPPGDSCTRRARPRGAINCTPVRKRSSLGAVPRVDGSVGAADVIAWVRTRGGFCHSAITAEVADHAAGVRGFLRYHN